MYYRNNVLLVEVCEAHTEGITPNGIKTRDAEYELELIIFATGYEALTGSPTMIDIHGGGGQTIKDKFAEGRRAYMGLQSLGFPNLFIMPGAGAGNFTRGCEPLVEWVSECIGYIRENEFTRNSAQHLRRKKHGPSTSQKRAPICGTARSISPGHRTGVAGFLARALALVPPDSHQAGRLLSSYSRALAMEEGDDEESRKAFDGAMAIVRQ